MKREKGVKFENENEFDVRKKTGIYPVNIYLYKMSDFSVSHVVVYVPPCNKDIFSVTLLGFWKTETGARGYLQKLIKTKISKFKLGMCEGCKSERKIEDSLCDSECQCECHKESYCFDSLCEKGDRKKYYGKLLDVDLCHPECGKNKFLIRKVGSAAELKTLINDCESML